MLLPETLINDEAVNRKGHRLVVTVASVIEPFLTLQHRDGHSQHPPELIPGTQIDVMLEGKHNFTEEGNDQFWASARLVKLVDVDESFAAIRSIIDASSGIMELGWSLTALENGDSLSTNRVSITRIAVLSVSLAQKVHSKEEPLNVAVSFLDKLGKPIIAIGSPFGVLSPVHFFNCVSKGSLANSSNSLLIADMKCLPGMEGSPVFCEPSDLIGILIEPLKQATTGAEIQLVIPWNTLAAACDDLLRGTQSLVCISSSSPVAKPTASVCLITMEGGVWASGVVINELGLVLTNSHLVEPWRFGKAKEDNLFKLKDGSRNIRVRLDIAGAPIWVEAKVVYVCRGPLDVALLQTVSVPGKISPVEVEFAFPSIGESAQVVGHGIFGPKSGLWPSVWSGVVAKVVWAGAPPYLEGKGQSKVPAMIETTAAVHPGGSGGAVLNADGRMIGLVTSNARHVGGAIIPHLNFSIPSALLLPIFEFSKDMKNMSLLESFDDANEELSSMWALVSPDPPRPVVRDLHAQEKGVKFAKFLADRNEVIGANSIKLANNSLQRNIFCKL